MKIKRTKWIAKSFEVSDDFKSIIMDTVDIYQELGLEVEIQYQQSDDVVSAFIIGRGE